MVKLSRSVRMIERSVNSMNPTHANHLSATDPSDTVAGRGMLHEEESRMLLR